MKKILIGRGTGNNIRLKDESDRVSRRQAVLEVSFGGKMRIHDTSSNGTFVNGERVPKPGGKVVKRGDKVDFAHVMDLDWSLIKDPYRWMKIAIGIFAAVLIVLAALYFVFADEINKMIFPAPVDTEKVDSIQPREVDTTPVDTVVTPEQKSATPKKRAPKKNVNDTKKVPDDKGLGEPFRENMPDPEGLRPDSRQKNDGSLKNQKK